MSKEIVGDLNVGRHVYVGGNLNVPGNAVVKRNVKIEGWLEAKNIKGVNKGLFSSEEALKDAYPEPKAGWWALVGDSIPAPIYRADVTPEGVQWVKTGENGGEVSVDLNEYVTDAELENELKGYLQEVPEEYITETELEGKGYAQQADVEALVVELSAHKSEATEAIEDVNNKVAELGEDVDNAVALGNNALGVANNSTSIATEAKQKASKVETDVGVILTDVEAIKSNVAAQEKLIESATERAETAGAKAETNETRVKQLQTDLNNMAAVDATMQGWHTAHSIINLHNFVSNMPTVETSVFPEYMVNVPSALLQNGLVVMINTLTGWEAWQLVDRENSLNHLGGYKQLAWDNTQVSTQIKALESSLQTEVGNLTLETEQVKASVEELNIALTAEVDLRKSADATQNTQISTLENFKSSQEVFNSAIETHIRETEEDYIGVKDSDGNGPLFPRLIALEAKVKELLAGLQ